MNHSDLVDATAEVISARLNGSSLRRMAVDLYGDTARAGLLADVRNHRFEHVSHATLHDLRRRMGLPYDVRYIVDVPHDADAAVHILPQGNGSLHTYTVPADAEVVVVPAGARVVQAKQPSKPARKRTRLDITGLPLNAQEARAVLLWWLEPYRRDWPDWVRRPLAQDAATDPGEVGEVLDGWNSVQMF